MIRASISGRLGGDPVRRDTRNGGTMVTVNIAINVAKLGDEPATEWISLVAFGNAAEALLLHQKGDLISAMGRLTRATYSGRDGNERTSWSLTAESLLSARTVYDHPPQDDGHPNLENPNSRPRRRNTCPYPRHRLARDSAPDFDPAA